MLIGTALLAGVVAVLVTLAIEHFGGTRGGLIGTLPSTIVLVGVGLRMATPDDAAFASGLAATPAGMLVNVLFLLGWREVPRRLSSSWSRRARFFATLALTLFGWAVASIVVATGLRALFDAGVSPLLVGGVATLVIFVVGALAVRQGATSSGQRPHVSVVVLMVRALLAASAVAVGIAFMKVGTPVVAGLASVFPAIFLTTMASLWFSHGEAVPAAAVGPMMLGSTSVAAYALAATLLLPATGIVVGSVLSWMLAAVLVTLPVYFVLTRPRR